MKKSREEKRKAIIDDGCNPELVAGAKFDGILEIPIIEKPRQMLLPAGITPFTSMEKQTNHNEAIGFYEMDVNFADILINPAKYQAPLREFAAMILPDCSLYRNAPLAVQVANVYRNRAIGSYYQRRGIYVIPQIRWGNELTYTTKYFPEKIGKVSLIDNPYYAPENDPEIIAAVERWKEKKYPGINMPGYSKWCLQQNIYEFILTQLEKRGMKIDRNT